MPPRIRPRRLRVRTPPRMCRVRTSRAFLRPRSARCSRATSPRRARRSRLPCRRLRLLPPLLPSSRRSLLPRRRDRSKRLRRTPCRRLVPYLSYPRRWLRHRPSRPSPVLRRPRPGFPALPRPPHRRCRKRSSRLPVRRLRQPLPLLRARRAVCVRLRLPTRRRPPVAAYARAACAREAPRPPGWMHPRLRTRRTRRTRRIPPTPRMSRPRRFPPRRSRRRRPRSRRRLLPPRPRFSRHPRPRRSPRPRPQVRPRKRPRRTTRRWGRPLRRRVPGSAVYGPADAPVRFRARSPRRMSRSPGRKALRARQLPQRPPFRRKGPPSVPQARTS